MLLMFQNKDKDLLGIYQYGCDPLCVSLLTHRHLKVRTNRILFTFSDKGAFTSACDSYHHALCIKKLAHDIVRYVSKFRRSDHDNYFFIGKKTSRKHFAKNNINIFAYICISLAYIKLLLFMFAGSATGT